jgi:predicted transcriptional regulator
MACVSPDGTLTSQARRVLAALRAPRSAEDVATEIDVPLYRVRSSLRELVAAGLLVERDGGYQVSAAGLEKLGG